jgi:hypothetical protein
MSARQNGAAAFMHCSALNDKSTPFQRMSKGFIGHGFLRIDPDDQRTGRTQEIYQPIKRDLQGFEGAPSPINQRDVILARRAAAVCRRGCTSIATPLQFQHQLDGLGARHDDSVLLRATRKCNHRFDDAVACGSDKRMSHDDTVLISLFGIARYGAGGLSTSRASRRCLANDYDRRALFALQKQTWLTAFARYERRHKESRWTKRPRYSDRANDLRRIMMSCITRRRDGEVNRGPIERGYSGAGCGLLADRWRGQPSDC